MGNTNIATCWIVQSGEYSDRWPLAVFTSVEKAEAYARHQRERTIDIDEFPLDPEVR